MTRDAGLDRWKKLALVAALAIVVAIPFYAVRELRNRSLATGPQASTPEFVGRDACQRCHESAFDAWEGSDHDRAMAVASESTVRGDFDDAVFERQGVTSRFYKRDGKFYVHTEGPDGEPGEFEIAYTFGHEPLQQYLIPFPGGRHQALSIAWDTERERWFHLYAEEEIPPDDWLHWTRPAQNWNGMCAECHSTNLRKGYDAETDSFATTWSEINVSCEACHGPGSAHVAWAEVPPMARPDLENVGLTIATSGISGRQQVELCAPCHSRRTELGDYDHARLNLMDSHFPSLLREGLYHADGQILDEVYVWGSFVQSKMYDKDVRCSDCHDAHTLEPLQPGNALCLQCHRADAYDTPDHHFHEKIVEGEASDGALCVKCHMPEQPYMVVDYRADHSLRVPRPDLSAVIGTPNACTQSGCHDDRPLQWSVDAYRRWYGIARRPHYGTTLAAARQGDPAVHGELLRLAGDALYPSIVRATALSLLARYPGNDTTTALRNALVDEDPLLRHTAVNSLVVPDAEERAALLAPLLFDPLKAVRLAAVSQLAGVPERLFRPYQLDVYRDVLQEYRETMEYSLDFAFAGYNLGNLFSRLGDRALAERYYERAIAVDDLFYPAKVNLAILLSQQGRSRESETLLRSILDDDPDNHEAAYLLGLLMFELQQPEEAVAWLELATQADAPNPRAFYNLGLLQQSLGRLAEAEASLQAALDVQPEDLEFLFALADHYAKRNRLADALALAERMIAAHPDEDIGHRLRADLIRAGGG